MKKDLMYFRKNTADNLTLNVELVNGDLAVVNKPVGRKAAGRRTETPVTRRQMPRVGVRRRRKRAR